MRLVVQERSPAGSAQGRGHKTSWVQRNCAIGRPLSTAVTTASQSWVDRPRCNAFAVQWIVPSRTVLRKFVFSSIVVKPLAPSGSVLKEPYPQHVSASATTVAPWRNRAGVARDPGLYDRAAGRMVALVADLGLPDDRRAGLEDED
jgi:hypothetical protein